ncbi:transposase [Nonomuraea sp. NPDC047897]|uniref:transposase n=1 Tax=Nonomuraea sp. NPDC047897 TaxID=3364346 RepID=UPI0037218312
MYQKWILRWDDLGLTDRGLGRSRGGPTTKLHLAVEQGHKPMSIVITVGRRGDSPQFEPVLNKIRVLRPGPGRPRTRPDRVRADKAAEVRPPGPVRSEAVLLSAKTVAPPKA